MKKTMLILYTLAVLAIGALGGAGGAFSLSEEATIGAGGLQLKVVFDKRNLCARLYLIGDKFIFVDTKSNQKIEWIRYR
ncbi:hypothetical protein [Desulfovibrio sp. JC010]|uniref:hypothetical protein n=1 Tax=Desulfovibrio sp. JC010 TaxID=2593641 RepID=UPI0013D286BD|nr:hypothetical protein [Desulfovibrio sp. JC010]NDV28758.1 hypothetical protein [Desulfovibrio sp. JC010]